MRSIVAEILGRLGAVGARLVLDALDDLVKRLPVEARPISNVPNAVLLAQIGELALASLIGGLGHMGEF